MKKHRKAIIILLCLVLLTVIVVFLRIRPISYQDSVKVCNSNGVTRDVEFDIVLHPKLLGGATMSGTIRVDGQEYVSVSDIYQDAFEGSSYMFQIPADSALQANSNTVIVDLYKDGFKAYRLLILESGKLIDYYGPAQNVNEVEAIKNK